MSVAFKYRMAAMILAVSALLVGGQVAFAQAPDQDAFKGDLGLGAYRIDNIAGAGEGAALFPYIYGDWGRWYGRVDTFGYKAVPMGYGHLELSTRISFEGYRPVQSGLGKRASPRLLGVGTFQETPVGGFFLYAFHDTVSGGAMLDATYAAEFQWRALTVYPELGLTRRSASYVQHLYGVSGAESALASVPAYMAGASTVPNAGWAMEWKLGGDYKWVGEFKRRWLDRGISQSPLVQKATQNSVLLAVVRAY
jgi:outer membrane protein